MQSETQPQLTQVPPKPQCTPFLSTGTCADLWRTYNQALTQRQREEQQLYIGRQKELAASQAAAPLQQQVADLNKVVTDQRGEIGKLREQIRADEAAALGAKSAARIRGLQQGTGIGIGALLVLFGLICGVRRLVRGFTITRNSRARAASA